VRDYFLSDLDRYADIPRGVIAHSTHVKGLGTFKDGVERSRVEVLLATGINEELCRRINLGYTDPYRLEVDRYRNREHEGILVVDGAGEILHRLSDDL
jgi:hypothetical protein